MLIILLILLVIFMISAWASYYGAPWVPVRHHDIGQILKDAKLTKTDHCVELGCGDGRWVKAVAASGAKIDGYEINPLLWLIAWLRCCRTPRARIYWGNFWRVNLGKYDLVFTFLVPRTMPKLGQKASAEMRPGSRLVSYIFEIKSQKPSVKGRCWWVYKY